MTQLNQAIEELNHGKIRFKRTSDACSTEGEIVIMLQLLERLLTKNKEQRVLNLDDFNFCQIDPTDSLVRFSELQEMVKAEAIIIDAEKMAVYRKDTRKAAIK